MKQIKLTSVTPVVANDGIRDVLLLFAVDVEGRLWRKQFDVGEWERVENPPASSRDYGASIVRGR